MPPKTKNICKLPHFLNITAKTGKNALPAHPAFRRRSSRFSEKEAVKTSSDFGSIKQIIPIQAIKTVSCSQKQIISSSFHLFLFSLHLLYVRIPRLSNPMIRLTQKNPPNGYISLYMIQAVSLVKGKNILYNEVYFHTETSLQGLPGDGIHAVFLTVSASAT